MAKRKDSIALFEVIKNRRNDVNLNVPKWMGGQGAGTPEESPAQAGAQAQPPQVPQVASSQVEPARGGDPAGQPVALKLTRTHLILGGAGVLVAILVAVWVGYSVAGRGETPQAGAGVALKNGVPPGRHVLGGNANSGQSAGAGQAANPVPQRQSNKYYLVIQAIRGGGAAQATQAKEIADWCVANGEPATSATWTQKSSGKQWSIVWSLRPFDSPRSAEALNFGRHIETLGKKYKAEYKKYDFRQQNAGKFDPWYLPGSSVKK